MLLLFILSAGAILWGATLVLGVQGSAFERFLLLLGLLGVLSAVFIFSRIRQGIHHLVDLPVFLTAVVFVEFGLAPLRAFIDPTQLDTRFQGSYEPLITALSLVVAGMLSFWVGSNCALPRKPKADAQTIIQESERAGRKTKNILAWATGLYSLALICRIYLVRAHMYSYTGSLHVYYKHLAAAQVYQIGAALGTCALVAVALEKAYHPHDFGCRLLFWAIFLSECAWGFISGMKAQLLFPILAVAVAQSLVRRKISTRWLLAIAAGLIVVYPMFNSYRALVRGKGAAQVTSVGTAVNDWEQATGETSNEISHSKEGYVESGETNSFERIDLLRSVGWICALRPDLLGLRNRNIWWMLPFYPFVPRLIWPTKPVENVALKLSLALGFGRDRATSITYPGDLYLEFGLPGVIAGMFILGLAAQIITNLVRKPCSKTALFIFASIFPYFIFIESDVFAYWSTVIKWLAILAILSRLVYHPRRASRCARIVRADPTLPSSTSLQSW